MTTFYYDEGGGTLLRLRKQPSTLLRAYVPPPPRLAVNCKFDLFLQRVLHDQFVCSIKNLNSLKKLLSQDKTFDECLNVAIVDEAADKESRGFRGNFRDESVHLVKGKFRNMKCFKCGLEGHFADRCNARNKGMRCKKTNHETCE